MSRLIYLRSPYFIKASASEGKTITSAQLDLYIWKGDLTDAPTEPTRSLEKSTEDSGNNYVTFEISEICRDELNISFDGVKRDTEPIYINYELSQTYSDDTTEIYSNIVFGLDGYKDFQEGPQVSENLFKDPSNINIVDEDENLTISIEDSVSLSADREYKTGADITITATFTPSTATLQWFKDTDEIDGETGSTYTITAADTDDEGTYFCRAYLNEGLATEMSEDSNDIVYTLSDCPKIAFNPDAQGSSYLSSGGAAGTTISIDVDYNTDCYTEIVAADVKMAKGDASPFTITSVTTVDVGVDKQTTVLLTTKAANVGAISAKKDRVIITYYDQRLKYNVPKNINVQQLAAAGAITGISWVGDPESSFLAKEQEFIISGEVGAEYEILVLPKYYDRDNDGKITDEQDYEWISQSDLDSVTGTIEADGDTLHTISVPQNSLAYQRIFNLVAVNTEDSTNRAVSSNFIQENVLDFAYLQDAEIEFTDENEEDMTFKYFSNADVEIRISKGSDAFRLISPEISDPGPPVFVFEEETETSVLYRGASAPAGTDITIRALDNNGTTRTGRISILYKDSFVVEDTLSLTQPGGTDFCIWQTFLDKASNRTPLNALNIAADKDGFGGLGTFVEVNSSVPFTVTVPDEIALKGSLLDPIGFGDNVSKSAGEYSFFIYVDADNTGTDTITYDLVLVSDDPDYTSSETLTLTQLGAPNLTEDAPVFDSLTLYEATRETVLGDWTLTDTEVALDDVVYGRDVLLGYGFQAVASDTNAGTLEYQWYLVPSFFPDNPYKINQDGDTFFFTPASAGELTYKCLVTNSSTSFSRFSEDQVITVSANEEAGVLDWVQGDDIVVDEYGNKNITVPFTGGTYELDIVGIDDDEVWRWQVSDFSTDLVVPNNQLDVAEESYFGFGKGPQTTSITFPYNYGNAKFVNVGFYDGPASNPNVIVKFYQAIKPTPIVISGPIAGIPNFGQSQSNIGSDNEASEQMNSGNDNISSIIDDLTELQNAIDQGVNLGGVEVSEAIDTETLGSESNEVHEAPTEVISNPQIDQVLSDLEAIQVAVDNGTLGGVTVDSEEEDDNGNNKEDIDSPVITPPVIGGGGGGLKPTPNKPGGPIEGSPDYGELF